MEKTWKELYPWINQPTPTKVTQSSQLLVLALELFVLNSEFLSVQQDPAILVSQTEIICLIDRTSFCNCVASSSDHGAAVSAAELIDKGSISIERTIFSQCSSPGYNSLNIRTSDSGSIDISMSTFANCPQRGETSRNIELKNGYSIINNINISHCISNKFAGLITDFTKGIRLSFSNICSNTATDSSIVYLMNGLIEQSNLISNIELTSPGSWGYNGVITINDPTSIVKAYQCYICDNTYLSKINEDCGTIEYIRCFIDGNDLTCSGDVLIKSTVSFDRYIVTLYASKDIQAEVPYDKEGITKEWIGSPLKYRYRWYIISLLWFSRKAK